MNGWVPPKLLAACSFYMAEHAALQFYLQHLCQHGHCLGLVANPF